MSNKSKCTIFEIRRPENVYIKPKRNILCETVHEIWKSKIFFSMAAVLNIAKSGGSINISGYLHQNSEIVWYKVHLCQMSCFCPVLSENVWPFLTLRALTICSYNKYMKSRLWFTHNLISK